MVVEYLRNFLVPVLPYTEVRSLMPPCLSLGDVDPAARVISLGPVSDVVDSGVLQQLNESSGHISACRSRELQI